MSDKASQPKNKFNVHGRFMSKKWLIIVVIFALFLSGLGAGWIFISSQKKSSTSSQISKETKAAQELANTESIKKTVNDAQALVNGGGSAAEAAILYDNAVKESIDPYLKSILLLDKATLYYNDNNYVDALRVANEAESIYKSDKSEQFIAQIYESMGDMKSALKYYSNAIALVDKSSPLAESDIKYYQYKIDELGGLNN